MAGDPFEDAVEVDVADGTYLIDVTLEGGSGRASVKSPAEFQVYNGRGVVSLVWSSKNYDYMIVGGKKYLPVTKGGNSTFVIPVLAYDKPYPVVGDTTAMSEAHEVDYTLTVALDSRQTYDSSEVASSAAQASASSAGTSGSRQGAASSAEAPSAQAQGGGITWPWIVFIVCVILSAAAIGATIVVLRNYRGR